MMYNKARSAGASLRSMEALAGGHSPVHRLHPAAKLFVTVLYIGLTVSFPKYSLSALAVMALYYGVGQWNSWFAATIYLSDNSKLPIQAVLRAILIANESILDTGMEVAGATLENSYAETIKYAVILISTVPILLVYPFLQKYFVNGVMIGAVKG